MALIIAGISGLVVLVLAFLFLRVPSEDADRSRSLKRVIVIPWVLMELTFIIFPFFGVGGVWLMALIVGASQIAGFAAWIAAPGHYRAHVFPEDVATAEGLMLTLAEIGGFIAPSFLGKLPVEVSRQPGFSQAL